MHKNQYRKGIDSTDNDKKKKFLIYVAFVTVIAALTYFVIKFCLAYLLPFIIGTAIAFLVQKPAATLSGKMNIRQGTASLCLVIGVYILLLVAVFLIINRIYGFAVSFTQKAPELLSKVTLIVTKITSSVEGFTGKMSGGSGDFVSKTLGDILQSAAVKVSGIISSFLSGFVTALPGMVLSIFAAVITGCYIAKDIDALKQNLYFALKPEYMKTLKKIWCITVNNVFGLFKGYLLLTLITFIELSVGFFILRVNGAFRAAFLTAVVDLLPVFGCGTVLIPWAIISAFKGSTLRAVGLVVIYLIITAVRNILEPKIIGKQVGLHPLITLISMFLGLKIFGLSGLVFLPLIVTVAYKVTEQKTAA